MQNARSWLSGRAEMSDIKPARMRDGSLYDGHKLYLGNGLQRSCGKCGAHKSSAGFKLQRPYGMVCPECQPKEKV